MRGVDSQGERFSRSSNHIEEKHLRASDPLIGRSRRRPQGGKTENLLNEDEAAFLKRRGDVQLATVPAAIFVGVRISGLHSYHVGARSMQEAASFKDGDERI